MPYAPPQVTATLIPPLLASAMIGPGMPKLALGIATGLAIWVPKIKITTVDAGTAGVGEGAPVPILVPQQLLYANILLGMRFQKILGPLAPVYAVGLSTGLSLAFLQMLTSTQHPTVGTGAAVAKFGAPPAALDLRKGFSVVGLVGDGVNKKSKALGQALDRTFSSLVLPVPIVGPPSPSPSSGSGFGSII